MQCEVLVVGAGPAGLVLAAELARRRVEVVLVDEHDAPLGWDRATVVHARSLELFDSLGLASRFLDAGVRVRALRLCSEGQTLGELDLALSGSRYGFDLGLSEDVTESILTDRLESLGGSIARATRLVDLVQGEGGAVATVAREGGDHAVDAQWIVGCDGFHSSTRRLGGIDFPGHDVGAPWAVFDCTLEGWTGQLDTNVGFLDDPPLILTALPGRRWRVYQRPTSATSDLVEGARTVIGRYAPEVAITAPSDAARFESHTRVASRYRSGRVLVAGDAAHVCSPAEGHGMNTGIQDALNLAWKLALVCSDGADPSILDSYELERRPVARAVGASGDQVDAAELTSDPPARRSRDEELRARFADRDWSHIEAVANAELDISYSASPIVGGTANPALGPGDRLPDAGSVELPHGQPCRLAALSYRAGHTLLLIGRRGTGNTVAELIPELAAISPTIVETVIALSTDDRAPSSVGRASPEVADRLGVGDMTMLLVRPDQYVAFRHDTPDPAALTHYLARLRGSLP